MRLSIAKGFSTLLIFSLATGLTSQATAKIKDVELGPGGQFVGRVVNGRGGPVAGQQVAIQTATGETLNTVSNKAGYFKAAGVRGGCCQVQTNRSRETFRLWSQGTAPPQVASQGAQLTDRGLGHKYGHQHHECLGAALEMQPPGPPHKGNPGGNGQGKGPRGVGKGHYQHGNGNAWGHTRHGRGHGCGHVKPPVSP